MSILLRRAALSFLGLILATSSVKASSNKIWAEFSGDKALAQVQRLVDFGPRPPESAAIEKSRDYIKQELKSSGWNVSEQAFTDNTPRGQVRFVNLIARFGAATKANDLFLLCSHYDTKIFDTFRFVGANDGGSSTGLLLELAKVLAQQPRLAEKIELVFFDGEEAFENFSDTDGIYGSRHFADELKKDGSAKLFRGGILLDMVGDRSLDITLPPNSPTKIARDIFAAADALKLRNYFTYFDQDVTDDHTPLNAIGIPVLDMIDFHYPPWHTVDDTMDKLSAQSLQVVGSVVLYYLAEFAFK
jgi:Zn-dependent M28 family amino/carboxypeptidase